MNISKKQWILTITCVNFLAFGMLLAALGPLLSTIAGQNQSTLTAIGGIYTSIFIGALLVQVFGGELSDRWGQQWFMIGSTLIFALGMAGISLSHWLPLTLFLGLLAGLGHGGVDLGGNILIARLFSERSVSALNLLNVFFGVGAFIGPALVSVSLILFKDGLPALRLEVGLLALTALALWVLFRRIDVAPSARHAGRETNHNLFHSTLLWVCGAIVLLYVGSETAMGGWTTTYLQQTTRIQLETASLVTGGFWLALTAGRIAGAAIGSRLKAAQVLALGLATALFGVILFLLGYGNETLSIAAVLLIGLGFGPVYPTTVAIVTAEFPHTPGQAGAIVMAAGSIGGMLIPWLQGVVLERLGTHSAAWAMVFWVGLLLAVFAASRMRKTNSL
jgi:fucose permease